MKMKMNMRFFFQIIFIDNFLLQLTIIQIIIFESFTYFLIKRLQILHKLLIGLFIFIIPTDQKMLKRVLIKPHSFVSNNLEIKINLSFIRDF